MQASALRRVKTDSYLRPGTPMYSTSDNSGEGRDRVPVMGVTYPSNGSNICNPAREKVDVSSRGVSAALVRVGGQVSFELGFADWR